MRVTVKGQVTIPQHIRELAGIRPHTEMESYYEDGKVWLTRARGRHAIPKLAGTVFAHERKKLEHLCRYITRPAIANERLALNRAGQVVLTLKTPYRSRISP